MKTLMVVTAEDFGEEGPSEEVHELEQTLLAVPMANGVQSPILK